MTDLNTKIQDQFSRTAANYAASPVHAQGEDLTRMVEVARARFLAIDTSYVLDAGCGAGHTALSFAPHVARVTAYDLTPDMLTQVERLATERNIPNVITQLGNVEVLPFDDATFDLVTSRYSAHHWAHPLTALREFIRVLKPGGAFLLSDIVAAEDYTQDTFLQAIELLRDPSHVRDLREREWTTLLQEAGFEVETIFTWLLPLNFDSWVARINTPAQNIAMLKTLFDGAPAEVRAAMNVQSDYTFSIPGALFLATKPA